MKNIIKVILLISVVCLTLCACSIQKRTDVYEFCSRLCKAEKCEIVSKDAYYKENNEYSYPVTSKAFRKSMITLTTDSASPVVNGAQLVLVKDGIPLSESEQQALYFLCVSMCSVLITKDRDEISEDFNSYGFSPSSISFSENSLHFTKNGTDCFLMCNDEIVTFFCEKTSS